MKTLMLIFSLLTDPTTRDLVQRAIFVLAGPNGIRSRSTSQEKHCNRDYCKCSDSELLKILFTSILDFFDLMQNTDAKPSYIALWMGLKMIQRWVQFVGGSEVVCLICCNVLLTTCDWTRIRFFSIIYWGLELRDKLKLKMMSAGVAILNQLAAMRVRIGVPLSQIMKDSLYILNKIPGMSVDLLGGANFGATARLENAAEKAARNDSLEDYQSEINASMAAHKSSLKQMRADAGAATADRESNIGVFYANAVASDSVHASGLESTPD